MPSYALAKLEDVDRFALSVPGVSQVTLDGLCAGRHARAVLDLHQSVIRERQGHHRRVGSRLMGVEVNGRLVNAHAESTSALHGNGFGWCVAVRKAFVGPETEGTRGCRRAPKLEQGAAGQGGGHAWHHHFVLPGPCPALPRRRAAPPRAGSKKPAEKPSH